MKKRKFYEWLIVLVVGIFLFYFIMSYIVVDLSLEEMAGTYSGDKGFLSFEAYTDNITFGQVFPGYAMNRMTHINTKYDFPVKIYFYPWGDIGEMVYVYPNSLYLEPGKEGEVHLYFAPSSKTDFGSYEGKLYILTRRTIFGV
ncbi:MAG: hypothetical protein KAT77_03950 [Nanoarchaeota archaeon]|nr:hypothetical protein [Nanoarchaeota archaeon]